MSRGIPNEAPRDIFALALGFAVVLADQSAKAVVRRNLFLDESWSVIPGLLSFTHRRNTGAVWGIFQQQNAWLILISLLVLVVIVIFYRPLVGQRWVYRVAMGFMIGGIVGNLIDRIKMGWVTDFLDFYWSASHWPSFNIADSAICVGVAIYLVSSLRSPKTASARASSRRS